jgi:hypothetical protein
VRRIFALLLLGFLLFSNAALAQGFYERPGPSRQSVMDDDWGAEFSTPPPRPQVQAQPRYQQPAPQGPVMSIGAGAGQGSGSSFVKQLGPRELNILSSRDVIILIDKSGSMEEKDCPPPRQALGFLSRWTGIAEPISRWDWCESELLNLTNSAGSALRQGLRVVMFASDQQVFDRVSLGTVPQIFRRNSPGGSTNAGPALKSQLDWYFGNKTMRANRVRPIAIAVITDGLPNNTRALKKAIVEATRSMERPDEIAITFLQIGGDRKGIELVHELDDNMLAEGAQFDIVDSKDFGELLRIGLGRALTDAIMESGRMTSRGY